MFKRVEPNFSMISIAGMRIIVMSFLALVVMVVLNDLLVEATVVIAVIAMIAVIAVKSIVHLGEIFLLFHVSETLLCF